MGYLENMIISKEQAKQFLLKKQGLYGKHQYINKAGCISVIKQAGCIQFDPIDRCGRNTDLVLFSRVKNYQKSMLDELLYQDYLLVDQWDKNMSIYHIDDWSNHIRTRKHMATEYENHLAAYQDEINLVRNILQKKVYVEAKDLKIQGPAHFYTWRHKKLGQAILDYLFFKGEVIIHHRVGIKRYFALAAKHMNQSLLYREDPFHTIDDYTRFIVKRRIAAIGMLSSGPSDAFLGAFYLKAKDRRKRFEELLASKEIIEVQIQGIKATFFILKKDEALLDYDDQKGKRLEFIAPLDHFIWHRKFIALLFDFNYKWEIYTPEKDRVYGAYVLPIIYGLDFVGRIDMYANTKSKTLYVNNIWFERDNLDQLFVAHLYQKISDFSVFNACSDIIYEQKFKQQLKNLENNT